jgi:tRNA-specific adenosine deaminase 2
MSEIDNNESFMKLAMECAQNSLDCAEIPVGCVFVHRSSCGKIEVIGSASNRTNQSKNGTRHAEMVAIDDILLVQKRPVEIFRDTDLYVTCEPCIMCAAALSRLGIRRVFFGCHNDRFGGNGSILSVNEKSVGSLYENYEVIPGIMKGAAISIFQKFYARENKSCPEAKRRKKE